MWRVCLKDKRDTYFSQLSENIKQLSNIETKFFKHASEDPFIVHSLRFYPYWRNIGVEFFYKLNIITGKLLKFSRFVAPYPKFLMLF